MKKVMVVLAAMLLMAGAAFAAPITLSNVATFTDAGVSITSGPGQASIVNFNCKNGHVHHLADKNNFVEWSQGFTFNPPSDGTPVQVNLTLRLRSDDNRWYDAKWAGGFNGQTWGQGTFDGTTDFNFQFSYTGSTITLKVINTGSNGFLGMGGNDGFYLESSSLSMTYNPVAPAPVPEPATMTLLGIGILGAGVAARKRNKKDNQ